MTKPVETEISIKTAHSNGGGGVRTVLGIEADALAVFADQLQVALQSSAPYHSYLDLVPVTAAYHNEVMEKLKNGCRGEEMKELTHTCYEWAAALVRYCIQVGWADQKAPGR